MNTEDSGVLAAVNADLTAHARQFAELSLLTSMRSVDGELLEQRVKKAVSGILGDLRQWAARVELELSPLYAEVRAGEAELRRLKEEVRPARGLAGLADRFWNWYLRTPERIRLNEVRWRECRAELERHHQYQLTSAISCAGIQFSIAERYAKLLREEMASV